MTKGTKSTALWESTEETQESPLKGDLHRYWTQRVEVMEVIEGPEGHVEDFKPNLTETWGYTLV